VVSRRLSFENRRRDLRASLLPEEEPRNAGEGFSEIEQRLKAVKARLAEEKKREKRS
jgi:hypothetical protein